MTDKRLWSYKDIAAHIKVQPDTVRSYRKHGLLPNPDHVESGKPYWYADTIRAWVATRPGVARRVDGTRRSSSSRPSCSAI
ncbi:helix-turn-helix transcriptional regulator [Streptomyces sp. NPDC058667]|uniref:helix-turn-helix transcriptional regulator n=1 Tax=Streptomyces sp. NPDC058667 TaxID=3346588 RepID=UPI003667E062